MSIVVLFLLIYDFFLNHLLIAKMTIRIIFTGKKISTYFILLIVLGGFLIPTFAVAQAKTVTGKVTGSDGAPVAGVTVQEKGTSTGTATDASGNFSLTVSKPDATLVVSSLGLISQTIALSGPSYSYTNFTRFSSKRTGTGCCYWLWYCQQKRPDRFYRKNQRKGSGR